MAADWIKYYLPDDLFGSGKSTPPIEISQTKPEVAEQIVQNVQQSSQSGWLVAIGLALATGAGFFIYKNKHQEIEHREINYFDIAVDDI